jgi:hypothetical protein
MSQPQFKFTSRMSCGFLVRSRAKTLLRNNRTRHLRQCWKCQLVEAFRVKGRTTFARFRWGFNTSNTPVEQEELVSFGIWTDGPCEGSILKGA